MIAAILTFNHPELSSRCIESVRNYFSDDKIFLLHNGSQKNHIEFLKNKYQKINHSILYSNKGFSGGANYLLNLAFANSDHVLFITNDCTIRDFDRSSADFFQDESIIVPYIYYKYPSKIDSLGGGVNLKKGNLIHYKYVNEVRKGYLNYVPGSCFIISKKVFNIVGGFDESLGTYWEDVDWSLRALAKKINFNVNSKLAIEHKGGKTCHKDKFYTSYLYQRNRIIICRRWIKNEKNQFVCFYIFKMYIQLIEKILIKILAGKKEDAALLRAAFIDSFKK